MSIEDILIRRQIFVQRYASSEALKAQKLIDILFGEVIDKVNSHEEDFDNLYLAPFRSSLSDLLERRFEEVDTQVTENTLEFADNESEFSFAALSTATFVALALPLLAHVRRRVVTTGMDTPIGPGSLTLSEAINSFASKKQFDINQVINDGILTGSGIGTITKNLSHLRVKHRRQMETVVRTAINHAASMTRKALAVENAAILDGEQWISALDSKTSLICAGRDGRMYGVGKGQYPPAHWNCRSIRVPIVKKQFAKGRRGRGRKQKFDGWLRKQGKPFQDSYFSRFPDGNKKAELFRKGLKIDRFRDETGKNFTLNQLKDLEPLMFGVDIVRPEGA